MTILIYDCEIIRAIPPKDPNGRINDIEYCGGWRDFQGMGVSVIGAYDYTEDRYRVFCRDNFDLFADLVAGADLAVGFNNIAFDNNLLTANGINVRNATPFYDLLVEIWRGAGLGPEFEYPTHLGFGLDAVCHANFGQMKSGHGAQAPVDWQQGRIGTVIDYCLNDVRLTKRLLDHVSEYGWIRDPRNSQRVIEVDAP